MVYLILGTGFEEIEAVSPCDILRRGGVDVRFAGIGGTRITGGNDEDRFVLHQKAQGLGNAASFAAQSLCRQSNGGAGYVKLQNFICIAVPGQIGSYAFDGHGDSSFGLVKKV